MNESKWCRNCVARYLYWNTPHGERTENDPMDKCPICLKCNLDIPKGGMVYFNGDKVK